MTSQSPTGLMESTQIHTVQPDAFYAQFRDQSRFWIQRVAVPLIMVIGLFGNLITVIIMTRRRMRSTTNMYLAALALVDMLYLVLTFLLGLSHYPNMAERDYYTYWRLRPFLMMLTDACSNTSVWLTVTFTIERFIAVRYPMKGKVWCTELRAKRLIAFVFLFGIVFASPVPFEWEVVERKRSPSNKSAPASAYFLTLENSDFGRNETYKTIYYWSTAVIFYFVPLLLLTFFNGFLILSVHRSLRERNRMTTGQQSGPRNHRCFSRGSRTIRLAGLENDCSVRISIEEKDGPTQQEVNSEVLRSNKHSSREETPRETCSRQLEYLDEEPTSSDCQQDLISKPDLDTGTSADKIRKFELGAPDRDISDHDTKEPDNAAGLEIFARRGCNSERRVEFNCSANTVREGTSTVQQKCDNMTNDIRISTDNVGHGKLGCDGDGHMRSVSLSPMKRMMPERIAVSKTRPTLSEAPKTNQIVAVTDDNIMSDGASPQNSNCESGSCMASQTATTSLPASSQERRITIMLIAVVILFLCCQIPSAAMLLYTSVREPAPNTNEHALVLAFGNIFNFLMAVNAAGNFILYSFLSKKYRRTFLILFCKCFQRSKQSPDEPSGVGRYLSTQYWAGNRSQASSGGYAESKSSMCSVFERWSKSGLNGDKLSLTRQLTIQTNELGNQLIKGSFAKHQRRDTLV